MSVIEVVNVSREVTWLPWAVQYFFLIGISVACFFMSLPYYLGRAQDSASLARTALIAAVVCGVVAPVALLADLHQPGRFWRFYTNPNLSSWMAWGAFFIPGYLVGLLVYAWAALKPDLAVAGQSGGPLARWHAIISLGDSPAPVVLKASAVFTVLMGFLILLYTGMEVMVVRARPLWNTPLLPLQFAATAFVGAAGLVMVLDRFMGNRDVGTVRAASQWLLWSLVATIVFGSLWYATGLSGLVRTHAEALASVAQLSSWKLTALWLAASVLLPLVLLWIVPSQHTWLGGVLALHAAWMFRWTVFIGGQSLPKTGAGEYAYHLPLGHDGLLGIAGTAGLWIATLIIVTPLIPSRSPKPAIGPTFVPAA